MKIFERISVFTSQLVSSVLVCLLVSGCSGPTDSEKITGDLANMTASPGPHSRLSRATNDGRSFPSDGAVVAGNRVELLIDGPETYDAMFAAINGAEDHINLETFILADDQVGRRLADALAERAANGVVVNVCYDAVGSMSTGDDYFNELKSRGINILAFHPLMETEPGDWHNRNHRKILIVDGETGFTGGLNFTENYRFDSESAVSEARFDESWRDTHLKIRGPAVAAMQEAFLTNWMDEAEGRPVAQADYFPDLKAVGNQEVAIVAATGDDELGSTVVDYLISAVKNASSRIWITQAYFAPTDELVDELEVAARRGVDVRVLLPQESDVDIAELAARAHYSDLLEAGVRIFEYKSGILHAKTAVIDENWSTVGSSNLDVLSIEFNNELNAIVLDRNFAERMAETFLQDSRNTDEITADQWEERSLWSKVKHGSAKLLQGGH